MIVRFDNRLIKEQRQAHNIGVEGDPETLKGTMSEADAIVSSVKKLQDEMPGHVPDPTPNAIDEREVNAKEAAGQGSAARAAINEPTGDERQVDQEPGPELNADALEDAKKKKVMDG
jgi:protein phosphatase PTC1